MSRQLSELGIYPAVDPLDSSSTILDPKIVGEEHYQVARGVQKVLQRYKDLQDIIAILGVEELSDEDKLAVNAGPQNPEISVPAVFRGGTIHGDGGKIREALRHDPRLQRNSGRQAR